MRIIITCFFVAIKLSCLAQVGLPFFHNYTPKHYHTEDIDNSPQNWSVIQDKRGVIYVANTSGVLEYDGVQWKAIKTTRRIGVQSLGINKSGQIYVGGTGDFGCLKIGDKGEWNFTSLVSKLSKEDKNFKEIFEIHCTDSEVYFRSENKIFRLKNDKIKVWTDNFSRSILFDKTFYVRKKLNEDQNELWQIKKDSLTFAFNRLEIIKEKIQFILPLKNEEILIGTKDKGFYIFNGTTSEKFITEVDDFILENQLYRAELLPDSTYALGTLYGGVAIINKSGTLLKKIDKSLGLQDETVISSYVDSYQGLWLGLNVGIARVEMPSPLSNYNETYGIRGIVMSVLRHSGNLYAATSQGVFEMKASAFSFQPFKDIQDQAWCLLSMGKSVLIGTNSGMYEVLGDKKTLINQDMVYSLFRSNQDSNRVFLGLYDGLSSLYFKNNKWVNEGRVKGIDDPVKKVLEDKNGNLWIYLEGKGLCKITSLNSTNSKPKIKYYFKNPALPEGWINPYFIKGRLIFGTKKGIYSYDEVADTFYRNKNFGKYFSDGKNDISIITEDQSGDLWVSSGRKYGKLLKTKNDYQFDYTASLRIPKTNIWCIYPDENGIIWYGTDDGLVRFDTKVKKDYNKPFYALIRKVKISGDSVIFKGTYYDNNRNVSLVQPDSLKSVLNYIDNSISFEFAAPFFDNESENQYSYLLEGFDKNWSEWSVKPEKEYTFLPEGKYIFHVRAKNVYENISQESTYEFKVLAPWYRTFWAYGGYGLGFLFFITGSVRLNSRRLKANQLVLEGVITERTAEILNQKEEIAKKNKDITDSINYAKKIQEAILPSTDLIHKALTQSFIFYKPKDIVSGDFYAFAERNDQIIIAAADCTGHGVPGAFMSMIGTDQLNQIIIEKGITKPSEILTQLNAGIKKSLKQKNSSAETGDGMDIALASIDLINNRIQYAGACRPMYLIRNASLQEIKGDKMSIGGATSDNYHFSNHEISIQKGDSFYLFSDGYADQFGGEKGKKMMTKNLKDLLLSIQDKDMKTQRAILEETFELWKGNLEQVDDILVIGFRI